MTNLEKRLTVLSNLGITIEHADGHRWIWSQPNDQFDLNKQLEKHGILLQNKVYGSVSDALDIVDECFIEMGMDKLIDWFWFDEDDIASIGQFGEHRNITLVESGKGGLV